MLHATKEDIDAEFPYVTPLHRRTLFAKIQDLKTHQRRRAESSKETKPKEKESKETKPAQPPISFKDYSGQFLDTRLQYRLSNET